MGEAFACHRHVLFEIGFSKSAKNEAGRKPSSHVNHMVLN